MPSAQIKLTYFAAANSTCPSVLCLSFDHQWGHHSELGSGELPVGDALTPQLFGPLLNWWTWNNFQPAFAQRCNRIRLRHQRGLTIFEQLPLEETSGHAAKEDLQCASDEHRTRFQGTYHSGLNLHTTIFRLPDAYFLLGVVMFHFLLQWHSCSSKSEQSPARSRANDGRQVIPLGWVRAGTPHLWRVREAQSPILSRWTYAIRTPLSNYSYSLLS